MGAGCGCDVVGDTHGNEADIESDDEDGDDRYKAMQAQFEYVNEARKQQQHIPINSEQGTERANTSGQTETSTSREGFASPNAANSSSISNKVSKIVTPIDGGIDFEIHRRLSSLSTTQNMQQLKVQIEKNYAMNSSTEREESLEASSNASSEDINEPPLVSPKDEQKGKKLPRNLMRDKSSLRWDAHAMDDLENDLVEQMAVIRQSSSVCSSHDKNDDTVASAKVPEYKLMIDFHDGASADDEGAGAQGEADDKDEPDEDSELFRLASAHKWSVEDVTDQADQMKKELLHLAQAQNTHLNV